LAQAEAPARRGERGADVSPAGSVAAPNARTVLYVEDNLSNLKLIQELLGLRPGIRLLAAMQGQLGLDLAREHRPDLILLDVHLPDIGGKEVLNFLREDPRTRDIPVAVISADATPGQIDRLLAAGARTYLTKPLDVKKFLTLIDEALAA
jgi:CheY-like chemotaxis protein